MRRVTIIGFWLGLLCAMVPLMMYGFGRISQDQLKSQFEQARAAARLEQRSDAGPLEPVLSTSQPAKADGASHTEIDPPISAGGSETDRAAVAGPSRTVAGVDRAPVSMPGTERPQESRKEPSRSALSSMFGAPSKRSESAQISDGAGELTVPGETDTTAAESAAAAGSPAGTTPAVTTAQSDAGQSIRQRSQEKAPAVEPVVIQALARSSRRRHTDGHTTRTRNSQVMMSDDRDETDLAGGGNPTDSRSLLWLSIPHIGVNAVVLGDVSTTSLAKGPGHYPKTDAPGSVGNCVIAAHRNMWGDWFDHLDRLRPGDEVILETLDHRYVYRVTGSRTVSPWNTAVLNRHGHKRELTLITCTHPATHRVVIDSVLDHASEIW